MRCSARTAAWAVFACGFILPAGCGPTDAAPGAAPGGSTAAEVAEDDAGPNPPAATFQEIVGVIDLRAFPVMEGATRVEQSPAGSHFSIPGGDVAKAVEFHREKLAALGWKPAADPKLSQIYPQGGAEL